MNKERTARLQRVFGVSLAHPNAVDVCPETSTVATIAGSTVVLRNFREGKERHVLGSAQHSITAVALTDNGRYMATGEKGSRPNLRIYELSSGKNWGDRKQLHSFPLHSSEIVAVQFVPFTDFVISIGCQQDAQLAKWDYKNGELIASGKLSSQVNSFAIAPDSSCFATVGVRHVKFWTIPFKSDQGLQTIQSRSAILADKRGSIFVDCVFPEANRLIAITSIGEVVEFFNKKYVKAYTFQDLKPTSISCTNDSILLGCTDGIVHRCSIEDMTFMEQLPLPAPFHADPWHYTNKDSLQSDTDAKFPSVAVVRSISDDKGVALVYEDNSVYVYIPHGSEWQRVSCHLSHNSPVNTILAYDSAHGHLSRGSFITGGTDGTVRIWNMSGIEDSSSHPNLLSANLTKLIEVEDQVEVGGDVNIKGVTSLAVSNDGLHLVAGSSRGNLNVYDMSQLDLPAVHSVAAHDGYVSCMDFSPYSEVLPPLFASGGSDKLVHLFKPSTSGYEHLGVIEDHKNIVKTIKFVAQATRLRLYSCSSDMTVLVWNFSMEQNNITFAKEQQIKCVSAVDDLTVWTSSSSIVAACNDGQLRVYDNTGKITTTIKAAGEEKDNRITTVSLDNSETFAIASCGNNFCYIVNLQTGTRVASLGGIGSVAKKAIFSDDFKRVVVIGSNGCIYVWRLSTSVTAQMLSVKKSMDISIRTPSPDSLLGSGSEAVSDDIPPSSPFGTSHSEFGSLSSLDQTPNHPVILATPKSKGLIPSIQNAQVTRRSNSNLLSTNGLSNEGLDNDSQSDFISRRRDVTQYQSSKSMLNLRDNTSDGFMLAPPSRRSRPSWGAVAAENDWFNNTPSLNSSYNGVNNSSPSPNMFESPTPSTGRVFCAYGRVNTEGILRNGYQNQSPQQFRQSPQTSISPTSTVQGLARIRNENRLKGNFERNSEERVSLSRKHMETTPDARPTWTSKENMQQKRTLSNFREHAGSPSGGTASAINRRQKEKIRFVTQEVQPVTTRPLRTRNTERSRTVVLGSVDFENNMKVGMKSAEDYTSSDMHLRSRSQSPNHIRLSQQQNESPLSIARERRRDSDMSFTTLSSRMTPAHSRSNLREKSDFRKSSENLGKLSAISNKLHKSRENLLKSSENLLAATSEASTPNSRTRSISNLRGGAPLEMANVSDRRPRGLMNTRLLAQSTGNVSNASSDYDPPKPQHLQNSLSMLKKLSNPDLTNPNIYEESPLAGEKTRRRGAVQKKVERFHPRNNHNRLSTGARQQTSEESDTSNTSDASPLHNSTNGGLGTRSFSALQTPRGPASRRLYEQQRYSAPTNTKRTSYLAQKLDNHDMGGPDIGADESPRVPNNKTPDWSDMLDSAEAKQLAKHVKECCEQLQVNVDKIVYAQNMVANSSLMADQKRIIHGQLNQISEKSIDKLRNALRPTSVEANGNDYTPIKGVRRYDILKNEF